MTIDLSPETQYPHDVLFSIITYPLVIIVVLIVSLAVVSQIHNAMPKKRYPKYKVFSNARFV